MIRWVNNDDLVLGQFVDAIERGSDLFAGPETAERMTEAFLAAGMEYEVRSSDFVDEGTVIAIWGRGS